MPGSNTYSLAPEGNYEEPKQWQPRSLLTLDFKDSMLKQGLELVSNRPQLTIDQNKILGNPQLNKAISEAQTLANDLISLFRALRKQFNDNWEADDAELGKAAPWNANKDEAFGKYALDLYKDGVTLNRKARKYFEKLYVADEANRKKAWLEQVHRKPIPTFNLPVADNSRTVLPVDANEQALADDMDARSRYNEANEIQFNPATGYLNTTDNLDFAAMGNRNAKALQQWLNQRGANLAEDGYYGSKTKLAILNLLNDSNLKLSYDDRLRLTDYMNNTLLIGNKLKVVTPSVTPSVTSNDGIDTSMEDAFGKKSIHPDDLMYYNIKGRTNPPSTNNSGTSNENNPKSWREIYANYDWIDHDYGLNDIREKVAWLWLNDNPNAVSKSKIPAWYNKNYKDYWAGNKHIADETLADNQDFQNFWNQFKNDVIYDSGALGQYMNKLKMNDERLENLKNPKAVSDIGLSISNEWKKKNHLPTNKQGGLIMKQEINYYPKS